MASTQLAVSDGAIRSSVSDDDGSLLRPSAREDVDVGVVHNGEPPHHRRGQSPATAAVDVADLGAELTQSSHHLGRHCAIAR